MQSGEFDFYFAENNAGIPEFYNDNEKEVVLAGVEWGVIDRAGSWFMYEDNKYQGVKSLVEALKTDKELMEKLKAEILRLSNHKGE